MVYSDHQRLELEKEFHYSRYITIRRKAELAASLGLSERQVCILRAWSRGTEWRGSPLATMGQNFETRFSVIKSVS